MAPHSHLIDLRWVRQDGGEQWCWKWQLGVLGSKRDYSLAVNPFLSKLKRDFCCWSLQKLLEGVCISGKISLCSSKGLLFLFASAQPICLWRPLRPPKCHFFHWLQFVTPSAELVSSVLWSSLLVWKREGCVCGFPTSSISKPHSQDSDAVGEYHLSLPLLLPLSHANSAKVFN